LAAAADVPVVSPDGSVRFTASFGGARPTFTVTFRDKTVVEPSPLAMTVDGADITAAATAGTAERYQIDEKYPWRGVHAEAVNHCAGVKIPLRPANGPAYTLEVRAFNDGIAFRCVVPGGESARVPDETTTFELPAGSTVWYHDLEGHYEAVHHQKDVSEVPAGQWCAPPMTFKLAGGGYASITEAALVNYSGMALQADGKRRFQVALGDKHPPSYPFRLRYKADIERVSKPARVAGTISTPWRVVMVGSDLNALVNSDIVHNLCPPPDPALFPQSIRTDWIKPGRAVWKYLDGGQNTFEQMKEFSRLAGELGFEYHVIEGFAYRWSDEQIKELVDYSRQRGVGIWLWRHSKDLRTPEAREDFFGRLERLGVAGAKIDFFDHEHKAIVDLYTMLLRDAARHHVMVNFHGANKPTGESRTWPNELIREGVRGMEARNLQARAKHNTTLPFTRYLAGHGDYTPVIFGDRRGDTTWAHQIATAAIFTEPLLTYGAHPATILKNPAVEMIKAIPPVWDETIVLPPSEIGELAVNARRNGDAWFLAVLNGQAARTLHVPLTFLGDGAYRTLFVRDQKDNPAAVQVENATQKRGDTLAIELNSGGGFVGRFTK
jgi:alpha-glucosidase